MLCLIDFFIMDLLNYNSEGVILYLAGKDIEEVGLLSLLLYGMFIFVYISGHLEVISTYVLLRLFFSLLDMVRHFCIF